MKKIWMALLTVAVLTSCHKDDPEVEDPTAERTVLIYMAAQNNLTYWNGTRFAELDLKEIKKGIKNLGDCHIVVYVDKAKDPVESYDDHNPYLLHYRKGELRDSVVMDANMMPSDPATLKTVAKKAFTDYPAKDYGLALWGHATGWLVRNDTVATYSARHKAYGGTMKDGSNNGSGNQWMNISSMAKALKALPHLKFIFADCCNMMCAEVAYELKDVTDYYIGSAAEIPGEGAPYEQILTAMMDKESFWKSICDVYANSYPNRMPLAVVKSSEMSALASATKSVLQSMKAADNLATYPNLSNLIYYLDRNLYDMNHFVKTYASESEYDSWKKAFDKAVIYKKYAKTWDTMNHVSFFDFSMNEADYGGISMFVPQWKLQGTDNENIRKMGWYYAAGYDSVGW